MDQEIALFAWTALWMGRLVLLSAFLPEPSLNHTWKRLVGWRIALAVSLLGEHIVRIIRQTSVAREAVALVLLLYVRHQMQLCY